MEMSLLKEVLFQHTPFVTIRCNETSSKVYSRRITATGALAAQVGSVCAHSCSGVWRRARRYIIRRMRARKVLDSRAGELGPSDPVFCAACAVAEACWDGLSPACSSSLPKRAPLTGFRAPRSSVSPSLPPRPVPVLSACQLRAFSFPSER